MSSRCYLGIDPGKKGGLALITPQGIFKSPIPLIKDEVDERELAKFITNIKNSFPDTLVIIEEVHSIFGTSASSNFTFGYIAGLLKGVMLGLELPYTMVQPKEWQKEIWINGDKVSGKPSKTGRPTIDTKSTSIMAVKRLYPKEDCRPTERSTNFHDGMVDAILIATFAKRMNL